MFSLWVWWVEKFRDSNLSDVSKEE